MLSWAETREKRGDESNEFFNSLWFSVVDDTSRPYALQQEFSIYSVEPSGVPEVETCLADKNSIKNHWEDSTGSGHFGSCQNR